MKVQAKVQEIERDLVRWQRGKWIAVVGVVFLVQVGAIIWASQRQVRARTVYPSEPKVAFAAPGRIHPELLELEDPFLFASASWNGFSGEAWLRPAKWTVPETGRRMEPKFLKLSEARTINPREDAERSFVFVQRRRAGAILPEFEVSAKALDQVSALKLSGFQNRTLAVPLPLPVQYHSDVVSSTEVEALVDRDGLVISARVIENSGSVKADADALALARRARFTPSKSGENVAELGKLIFEWYALDLSHTNNVKR